MTALLTLSQPLKILYGAEITFQDGGSKNWVTEQLSSPYHLNALNQKSHQIGISSQTYRNSFTNQASFLIDFNLLELFGTYSLRYFPSFSDTATQLKAESNSISDNENKNWSLGLARCFLTEAGHFGRLGVSYNEFLPHKSKSIHLNIQTGVQSTETQPYSLAIGIHFFKKLKNPDYGPIATNTSEGNTLSLSGEIAKTISFDKNNFKWRIGGFIQWSYRNRDYPEDISSYTHSFEHMLFGFGISSTLDFLSSRLKLTLPIHLTMNKEIRRQYAGKDANGVDKYSFYSTYPSALHLPDVALEYVIFL